MATLVGYSIPAQFNKRWDHTYVQSDDRYTWECFGSDAGGSPLCSGIGDSTARIACHIRDFLLSAEGALPGITKYAGITYGTTGVCHQAANRILYPAGVIVAAANGYGWSLFLYDTYGTEGVPLASVESMCYDSCESGHECLARRANRGSEERPVGPISFKGSRYLRVNYWPTRCGFCFCENKSCGHSQYVRLGSDYDRYKFNEVANLQLSLRKHKQQLTAQLESRQLNPGQFSHELRRALTKTALQCEAVLSAKDFSALRNRS